jgi:hypothetical protein
MVREISGKFLRIVRGESAEGVEFAGVEDYSGFSVWWKYG